MKTISILIVLLFAGSISAQDYNYAAQKSFIPKDLGKVYLGMSLKDFAEEIPVGKAEANGRFEFLELNIPFAKGNIKSLRIRVAGISNEEKQEMIFEETTEAKDSDGFEYDKTTEYIDTVKIPKDAFVYSMYVEFKETYDLKSFVVKAYGKDGEIRKPDDEYHFFDIQWSKKTGDGLSWLIRSFHEGDTRSLQLLGRINGTEWEVEEMDD